MTERAPPLRTFFPTVLLLSTLGFVATDIYLPSFPSIQGTFSTTKSAVQLSLSLFLLSLSFSQLIYGPLSDQLGRKKIALSGLAFSLLGTLLCLFSWSISSLIVGRFLQGFGMGAGNALARAIQRDVYSGDGLAHFGSLTAIGSASLMAAAPTLGGYIQHFLGWRATFIFLLLYTLYGLLSVWFWLPETNKHPNPSALQRKVFFGHYLHLMKNPIFLGYSGCASLSFAGFSAYFASSPFLFETLLGLTPVEYGWLALLFAAGLGIGAYFNIFFLKLYGRHRMLVVGIVVLCFSGALMLSLGLLGIMNVWSIILPIALYTFGAAMTLANSFAGAFHPFAQIAGFAGALYGCLQILGGVIGSTAVAMIREVNQIPLSIILLCIGIGAYFLQWLAFRYSVTHPP